MLAASPVLIEEASNTARENAQKSRGLRLAAATEGFCVTHRMSDFRSYIFFPAKKSCTPENPDSIKKLKCFRKNPVIEKRRET